MSRKTEHPGIPPGSHVFRLALGDKETPPRWKAVLPDSYRPELLHDCNEQTVWLSNIRPARDTRRLNWWRPVIAAVAEVEWRKQAEEQDWQAVMFRRREGAESPLGLEAEMMSAKFADKAHAWRVWGETGCTGIDGDQITATRRSANGAETAHH